MSQESPEPYVMISSQKVSCSFSASNSSQNTIK